MQIRPTSGSDSSRGSVTETAMTSWRRLVTCSLLRRRLSRCSNGAPRQKSDTRKMTDFRWMTWLAKSNAFAISVPRCPGWKYKVSRISRMMCIRPLPGGMYNSTVSLKRINPTLSRLRIAEAASTPAASAASSRLESTTEPKSDDALTSIISRIVSSRSSVKSFTCGSPVRAVTFQSIVRTSSPGT